MIERYNQVLLHLQVIQRFINLTDSGDEDWMLEQENSNQAIEDIRTLLNTNVHKCVFQAALNRERWMVLVWEEEPTLFYVTATYNRFCVGRSFLKEELEGQANPTQFMIDWFLAHNIEEGW